MIAVNFKNDLILAALACNVLIAAPVNAADVDASATIERDTQSYVVSEDGSWSMLRELAVRINDERGVDTQAQQSVGYNKTLDTLDVVEAYTEKADGRRIKVGPDQIREQEESHSADVAMFQDLRIKTVIFPDVEVGDRVILVTRQHEGIPLVPGQFQDLALPWSYATTQRLIYDLPASMPLQADARGYSASSLPAAPGRVRYQYDYQGNGGSTADPRTVSPLDYGDRLAVSTMRDYAAFAAAYEARADERAAVTPALVELANNIVGDMREPRRQALALSEWVRKNIRYVAVYVGAGGIVPHAAAEVVEHRYGDCKDHAVLLEALLKAVGIDSTQALISSGNAFSLLQVPALGVLNHVINYVPALDLYLDSTARSVSAGFLPDGDLGKPTVLTKLGRIGHTPATQVNARSIAAEISVDRSGAASLAYSFVAKGAAAEPARLLWRSAKPNMRGFGDTADTVTEIAAGPLNDGAEDFRASQTHHRKAFIASAVNGHSAATIQAGLILNRISVANAMAISAPQGVPRPCVSETVDEHLRVTVPPSLQWVELPKGVAVHVSGLDYTSSYIKDGDAVVIQRHYSSQHPQALCTPDDTKALSENFGIVMADILANIEFKTM